MEDLDTRIIETIGLGFLRWDELAEELDVPAIEIRRRVRRLCERYACPMIELPARAAA